MRRREFLIASSVGAALSAAGLGAASVPLGQLHAVVYDPRYAVAREFAEQHEKRGIALFSANDCMVRLWRGPLAEVRERGAIRIAGTTLYSDFAIARDCARDLGLRVLREKWLKAGPVTLVNWLIGIA